MSRVGNWIFMIHSCMTLFWFSDTFASSVDTNRGWSPFSPRAEISPNFQYLKNGVSDHKGCWVIEQGEIKSQIGAWSRQYPVTGDKYYQFEALGGGKGLSNPRANCYVEIFFQDDKGKLVMDERAGNYSRPFYPWSKIGSCLP